MLFAFWCFVLNTPETMFRFWGCAYQIPERFAEMGYASVCLWRSC